MSEGIFNNHTGYHNRRSIRLRGYDYSGPGRYFVTICIDDPAQKLFGDVVHGKMVENEIAAIIHKWWDDLPDHFNNIGIDEFIVMPNHIHGIIVIRDAIVGTRSSRPTSTHPRITGRDDPDSNGRDDPAQQSGGMTPPLLHSPKP